MPSCHFTIISPIAHGAGQPCAVLSGIAKHAGPTGHTTGQVSGPLTNVQSRSHFSASAAFRKASASHSSVFAAEAKQRIRKERTARLAQVVCDVFGMNALHVFFAPTGYSNRFKEHDLA